MSYFKYVLKGFKANISRMLAIVAIITLGIGFLVGLSTSSTDIRTSVNEMYSDTSVMDINVKSTIGFSESSVDKLNNIAGIQAEGIFQIEPKTSTLNGQKIKARVVSRDFNNDKLNLVSLIDGRLPLNKDECVVLNDMEVYNKASIGDTIRITDDKLKANKEYKVVGIVNSPLFFAKDKEYNLTGTNRLDLILFIDEALSDFDLVTDIYIKTDVNKDRFSGGYFDSIKKTEDTIKDMKDELISVRREEIKLQIKEEILGTTPEEIASSKEEIKKTIDKDHKDKVLDLMFIEYAKTKLNQTFIRELIQEGHTEEEAQALLEDYMKRPEVEVRIKDKAERLKETTDPLYIENTMYPIALNAAVDIAVDIILEEAYTKGAAVNGEDIYVLNLKSNQSYVSVRENSNKIDKIAVIFPVFFYFIAALVALTTITRLVDEERGEIGLFKSLGFSKAKILSKYLVMALVCSVVGSLLGNLAGIYLLPYIIFGAYKTILELPPIVYNMNNLINIISIVIMIVTIMGVSAYVTLKSLREKPAELLQPKAPKPGKRLLLERWKGLWKRVSFKYKNTLRNIFRYKKNLIMMMVGVGGCVALLLTAFGIRDAFDKLASVQFDKIVEYDLRVSVDSGTELPSDILIDAETYNYLETKAVHIEGDDDYTISKVRANSSLEGYFSFMDGNKKLTLKPGDVFIDRQLKEEFKLNIGSTFKLDGDDTKYTVSGVFDNHIDNYIFIYDEALNEADCNTYYLNLKDSTNEDDIISRLSIGNVIGIESISSRKASFDTMLSSIVLIIVVVIICSGALAVIVIYNLTNININERVKEIATLKVLGYQNREVYGYIYREIFVLTILGILLGFLIGPFLYQFVMLNLHEPGLFLPVTVHPLNYLYSFLFTLLFAFIVDLILVRKIKRIKMVESLKCVD